MLFRNFLSEVGSGSSHMQESIKAIVFDCNATWLDMSFIRIHCNSVVNYRSLLLDCLTPRSERYSLWDCAHRPEGCSWRFCIFKLFPLPPLPLSMLADKLNMTPEEAERWIVNLIRNARLDAKIDSKLVSSSCVYRLLIPNVWRVALSHVNDQGQTARSLFIDQYSKYISFSLLQWKSHQNKKVIMYSRIIL